MAVKCEKWTTRHSNTLRGFADVLLEQTHLRIRDVAIHTKNGETWAQLPARPQIGRDGVALRDEQTGKLKYSRIIEFDSRQANDEFSRAAIAAVLERFPSVLDDDGDG